MDFKNVNPTGENFKNDLKSTVVFLFFRKMLDYLQNITFHISHFINQNLMNKIFLYRYGFA
jgi:hypothetical protein